MYGDRDDNENEQKNLAAYKLLGEQMAFLSSGLGNVNENQTKLLKDDVNKGKIKNGKGMRATMPINRLENRKNTSFKNPFNESDIKLQNTSNMNNTNISNNDINNTKKNQIPIMKNRSNSSTVENPFSSNNQRSVQRNTNIPTNKPNKSNNQYQYNEISKNKNNSNNESLSNAIPEIEIIEVEKVNEEELEKEANKSINNLQLDKIIVSKGRQHSIYERSMKNLKKKETKLAKIRKIYSKKILEGVQRYPKLDKKSVRIILRKGEYIPIENRAAQIHSQHLTQIILNEELNRMETEKKEDDEIKINVNNNRKYEKKEWDEFVEKCFEWKKKVIYERRAAEIFRYKQDRKVNYKPTINENSKKLMKKIMNKNNHSVDDVFTRLYNDYDEHKERQKILNEKYEPTFNPMINNFQYAKNFWKNKKYRNNSIDNSYELFVTDSNKNNFFLESQKTINHGKLLKMQKKARKFVNIKPNKKEENINIKSYKPTQATNNTTSYLNTEMNINKNKYKRYLPTENNLTLDTNLITYQNNIPTDMNLLTDENKIINELNENNNSVSNNDDMINEERILKELNEAKEISKERFEKENGNSLYKINIMESTPQVVQQNVIIPSNKYQDFFDIEEINEL